MASRLTYSGLSAPPLAGEDFFNEYAARLKTLFDASALPLTAVGGTANAVTATLDPALDTGGLVDGMKFQITWGAANTAGVTLALNGGAALPVVDAGGNALVADSLASGLRSLIEYIAGGFRILSPLNSSGSGGSARYYQAFTASGTWTKPAGLDADTLVTIEAWGGGGGGGSSSGGGGGGGYAMRRVRLGDLPSSVAVTIGAGGAGGGSNGVVGGNTTFGSLLTAYGGGRGTSANGGGGGGASSAGNSATAGRPGGGAGGSNAAGSDAIGIWGGGGGGGAANAGGWAVFGGGGGAGAGAAAAGTSVHGGNGGTAAAAGAAPGGGGGGSAGGTGGAGARGEVRVWI